MCFDGPVLSPATRRGAEERRANRRSRCAGHRDNPKKYEFSPSAVHVKAGRRIRLKITAIDRDHGFTISVVPESADAPIHPSLEFDPPQGNNGWKLKKSEETKIEFVAKTAGTYEFRCSVACGIHHGRMKGQLVVDP